MSIFETIKNWFAPKEKKIRPQRKFHSEDVSIPNADAVSIENGDCSCIHCHRSFWYQDFIGLCTSRECSDSDTIEMDIQKGSFYTTSGPRQILLREETAENVRSLQERPIEVKLSSKSHFCPVCSSRFYFYACPHCRHSMPRLRKIDLKHTIAPVGIGSSGKSIYMIILIHKLLEDPILKTNIKVISNFLEKVDFDRYREKHAVIFRKKTVITSNQRGEIPAPYLLATTTQRKEKKKDLKAFTLWYDFAGEDLEFGTSKEAVIQYVTAIGGIFFIVDPTNSQEIVKTLGVEANDPQKGADEERDVGVLTQVGEVVGKHSGDNIFQHKHIAVIVSKVDIFQNTSFEHFRDDSIIWQTSPHQLAGEFSLDDFEQVNREVEQYVLKYHKKVYAQILRFHNKEDSIEKSNIGFFAVSALGQNPITDQNEGKKLEKEVVPIRVEDPFYWMLWKMGHLKPSESQTKIESFTESPEDKTSFDGGDLF